MTTRLADLLRAGAVPGSGVLVEHAVFGTGDAEAVADWYSRFCEEVLRSPVASSLFYAASSGCVAGIELADGRRLAVKAYQGRWRLAVLELVSAAQRKLATAGFPCPIPEIAPVLFEDVPVSVEQLLLDPGVRVLAAEELEASAAGLAELGRLLRDEDPAPWHGLHAFDAAPGALYPQPHSPLFDFTLRDDEVGWIDELAEAGAAARSQGEEPLGLFHCDWSARNVRFAHRRLVASYDWDSLNACRESTAAGNAAATWRSTGEPDDPPAPGPTEIDGYLDAYLRAAPPRTACTQRTWRCAAMGQALWILAYTARCEHALEARYPELRPRRARDTLDAEGRRFLGALSR